MRHACCNCAGLLYGRPEAVFAQPEIGKVVQEVMRALSPASTTDTVRKAGAAAGAMPGRSAQQWLTIWRIFMSEDAQEPKWPTMLMFSTCVSLPCQLQVIKFYSACCHAQRAW